MREGEIRVQDGVGVVRYEVGVFEPAEDAQVHGKAESQNEVNPRCSPRSDGALDCGSHEVIEEDRAEEQWKVNRFPPCIEAKRQQRQRHLGRHLFPAAHKIRDDEG